MHIGRLFNVLVIGGFAITGCSGESKDDSSQPLAGAGSAGRDAETQAGNGGTAGEGAASGGTSNTASSTSEAGSKGDAGHGNSCECNEQAPFFCGGVCCMWMFGEDAPCCDKL